MTWKFVASDNFSLDDLLDYKKFYEDDLRRAVDSEVKSLSYRKFGLPNWRYNHIRVQMATEEAERNLNIVNRAIEIAKERGL